MASSYSYFKEDVKKYLEDAFDKENTILDVGAGKGTYYDLIGNYFKNMDAVEAFKPNIEKYELEAKYNTVYNVDIKDFEYDYYDIIIFGDIIEHLGINEAQNVLKYAYMRCKEMVVAVPYEYKQGVVEDNIYEIHKQDDLTHEIFLGRYPFMKLLFKNDRYGYYVKGEKE